MILAYRVWLAIDQDRLTYPKSAKGPRAELCRKKEAPRISSYSLPLLPHRLDSKILALLIDRETDISCFVSLNESHGQMRRFDLREFPS